MGASASQSQRDVSYEMAPSLECPGSLDDFKLCDLYACIRNIKGLPSNSASPTDTMIVTFKHGTSYRGIPITSGFLKLFRTPPDACDQPMEPQEQKRPTIIESARNIASNISGRFGLRIALPEDIVCSENYNAEYGLLYEMDVYQQVTNPLINNNICPYFVRSYFAVKCCHYKQILYMLYDHLLNSDTSEVISHHKTIRTLFLRSYMYMSNKRRDFKVRPSLGNMDPTYQFLPLLLAAKERDIENAKTTLYSFSINETMSEGTIDFGDYVDSFKGVLTPSLVVTLFQINCALYAMELTQLSHSDLHEGNIFIKPIPWTFTHYEIDNVPYTFSTHNMPLLYDFDRSYCARLGNNKMCEKEAGYHQYHQKNSFVKNRDAFKFWCQFLNFSGVHNNNELYYELLKLIGKDNLSVSQRHELNLQLKSNDCYLIGIKEHLFSYLDSPVNILRKLAGLSKGKIRVGESMRQREKVDAIPSSSPRSIEEKHSESARQSRKRSPRERSPKGRSPINIVESQIVRRTLQHEELPLRSEEFRVPDAPVHVKYVLNRNQFNADGSLR